MDTFMGEVSSVQSSNEAVLATKDPQQYFLPVEPVEDGGKENINSDAVVKTASKLGNSVLESFKSAMQQARQMTLSQFGSTATLLHVGVESAESHAVGQPTAHETAELPSLAAAETIVVPCVAATPAKSVRASSLHEPLWKAKHEPERVFAYTAVTGSSSKGKGAAHRATSVGASFGSPRLHFPAQATAKKAGPAPAASVSSVTRTLDVDSAVAADASDAPLQPPRAGALQPPRAGAGGKLAAGPPVPPQSARKFPAFSDTATGLFPGKNRARSSPPRVHARWHACNSNAFTQLVSPGFARRIGGGYMLPEEQMEASSTLPPILCAHASPSSNWREWTQDSGTECSVVVTVPEPEPTHASPSPVPEPEEDLALVLSPSTESTCTWGSFQGCIPAGPSPCSSYPGSTTGGSERSEDQPVRPPPSQRSHYSCTSNGTRFSECSWGGTAFHAAMAAVASYAACDGAPAVTAGDTPVHVPACAAGIASLGRTRSVVQLTSPPPLGPALDCLSSPPRPSHPGRTQWSHPLNTIHSRETQEEGASCLADTVSHSLSIFVPDAPSPARHGMRFCRAHTRADILLIASIMHDMVGRVEDGAGCRATAEPVEGSSVATASTIAGVTTPRPIVCIPMPTPTPAPGLHVEVEEEEEDSSGVDKARTDEVYTPRRTRGLLLSPPSGCRTPHAMPFKSFRTAQTSPAPPNTGVLTMCIVNVRTQYSSSVAKLAGVGGHVEYVVAALVAVQQGKDAQGQEGGRQGQGRMQRVRSRAHMSSIVSPRLARKTSVRLLSPAPRATRTHLPLPPGVPPGSTSSAQPASTSTRLFVKLEKRYRAFRVLWEQLHATVQAAALAAAQGRVHDLAAFRLPEVVKQNLARVAAQVNAFDFPSKTGLGLFASGTSAAVVSERKERLQAFLSLLLRTGLVETAPVQAFMGLA